MNVETKLIRQVTPIKFTGEDAFILPNHSGITGNTDAVNKLDARYGVAATNTPTIYRGTDFVGANPNKVLTHSRVLPNNVIVVIGGRIMYRTLEYTIAGNQITMVDVIIDDGDYIMVCD